jgi:hypothetical protein
MPAGMRFVAKAFTEGVILCVASASEQAIAGQISKKVIIDKFLLYLIKKYVIDCISVQFRAAFSWRTIAAPHGSPAAECTAF